MKAIVALMGCLLVVLISGCSPQASPEPPTATPTIAPSATVPAPTTTETLKPTRTSTRAPAPTSTKPPTVVLLPRSSPTVKARVTPGPFDPAYLALLESIKQGDADADFTAARMAYANSGGYDPYGYNYAELKSDMYDALNSTEYEKTLELANEVMQYYYLSPDAHIAAFAANDVLGNAAEAGYHRGVILGLVASLEESGDGQSMETAYEVISIEEEYMMLEWLDIQNAGQQLVADEDHRYDVFEGVDGQTNAPVKVYFNIDIPFKAFARLLQ